MTMPKAREIIAARNAEIDALRASNRLDYANRGTISFFAAGIPKGQPRPKATMRGRHAGVYDPGTANGWKLQVAIAAREHKPTAPLDCPLRVSLEFIMPRPKSHFGTGKNASTLKDSSPNYHTGTPDCDNLAKAVLDELTQLGFWTDDCAVAELTVKKTYSPVDQTAGCFISIYKVLEAETQQAKGVA